MAVAWSHARRGEAPEVVPLSWRRTDPGDQPGFGASESRSTFEVFDVPTTFDDLGKVSKLETLTWHFRFTAGRSHNGAGANHPVAETGVRPRARQRPPADVAIGVEECSSLCARASTFAKPGKQPETLAICRNACVQPSAQAYRRCLAAVKDSADMADCSP